jgi:4-amino-4-deoxy-L-arabinose transferase-like glycosyltransferase
MSTESAAPARAHPHARLGLAAICALAGVLYAWGISSSGWGNPYYSAAVKSMTASLTTFLFGSFDPLGVVTVDKPPMALWAMVLSAAVFGYHGWSLLLTQVVEGVATVVLLHRAVRWWAGERVALLAALVLTLTPVTVAINRDTNPDTLMVLLLVAAAYALTRSVHPPVQPGGATRWLMLAGVLLGLGFVTKMLQAWIVVPAFALAYLAGAAAPWRRRLLDLLGAGAALLGSSLWWVALVSVWPAPKPYIGGSADGSMLNLIVGYNGLSRLFGRGTRGELPGAPDAPPPPFSGVPAGRGGFGFGGQAGLTRLFADQVGGQISWLLPLCLGVLVAVTAGGVARSATSQATNQAINQATGRARRAGWVLWGGWLVFVGVVLSFAQGIFHPYYTTEMAPAVAAVTAAGMAGSWRLYHQPGGYRWMLLPVAVVLTAGWAWVLVSRDTSWHGWLRYAVAGVSVLAVLLLVAGRFGLGSTALLGGTLGLVAVLLAPAVWSVATAFAPAGGALAQAGPPSPAAHRFGLVGAAGGPGGPAAPSWEPLMWRGAMRGELTAGQRELLAYVQANASARPITLAVEGGAMAAAPYLIHSDARVVGMGGFSGQDPAPAVATLAQWVQQGRLRFVLESAGPESAGRNGSSPDGSDQRGWARPGGVAAQRIQWVRQHCTPVGRTSAISVGAGGAGVLYDCH